MHPKPKLLLQPIGFPKSKFRTQTQTKTSQQINDLRENKPGGVKNIDSF
jgi:hypothetical protein